MRFQGLDLNLLVAFDVFLEVKSIRKSAERLNLSQPAASAALSRIREYFKDPILVQHGQKMYPTPYAESLLPHVRNLLTTARTITSISSEFIPASSTRVFRIVASDYFIAAFFADVVQALSLIAPNIRFELSQPDVSSLQKLELGELDVVVTPPETLLHNFLSATLYEDSHVLVGCKNNPIFTQTITSHTFEQASLVSVRIGDMRATCFAEKNLLTMGIRHHITLTCPSFTLLPWLLKGTTRLNVMPKRLANKVCREFSLEQAALPFELPMMEETLLYHHSRANDEGLVWLINQLKTSITNGPINP